MSTVRNTRIALIDDHSLFAEALEAALSLQGFEARRFIPPPESAGGLRVVAEIERFGPAIVLLDLDLGPAGDGGRLVKPLTGAGARVIVLTGSDDRGRWGHAVAAGARKVVSKTAPLHEIIEVVRRCSEGLPLMTRAEAEELVATWRRSRAETDDIWARLDRLTQREAEVLGQLMLGIPVGDIAANRVVSESTVRTQVKAVLAKLHVGSQLSAVGLANRVGWKAPMSDARH